MTLLRSALLATALTLPATAAFARPLTPEDVARVEYTGSVAVSPDGERVAFTKVHFPDVTKGEENGGARQQLFLIDGAMQAEAWLPEEMRVSSVGFTPDGSMVTFLWTAEDDKRGLWGVPVNGGSYRKIAGIADAGVSSYQFSPDGSQVYFLTGGAPDEAREAQEKDGFDSVVYEEEFSFNRMWVADVQASGVDEEPTQIEVPGQVYSFDVAPSGDWVIFTSAPTPLVDDEYTSLRPHILDLQTGEMTIVETPGKVGDIEIAPDSSVISMMAAMDKNDPADTTLYLIDPATGTYTGVNEGAPEAAVNAEWMADGRLAVHVDKGATSVLRFYSPFGAMLSEIETGGIVLAGLEQGGNRLVVEGHTPTHPQELFMFDGGSFERWTDHNPWLSEITFGEQRTFTFNARDGQEIEGILIEPIGGIPEGGAPLIFDIHGGPEAHDTNGWMTNYGGPGQVGAGAGYAVAQLNYRGSTGYGTAFSKQHQDNYTDPEFTDIVDAKYHLVEQGIVDPDRVGITGGSYGGYATAWSSTYHSDEFAAGVMFVGISNQISKMGTGDIPMEMFLVHALKWPWDDWNYALSVSPIYYADRANTPLLIMHGDADPRVSPTQSTELYRHITIRRPDTPLRLVFYPDEGHGNAMAAARYDYNVRMMEWFDTYLMTGDRDAPMPGPRPELKIEEEEE